MANPIASASVCVLLLAAACAGVIGAAAPGPGAASMDLHDFVGRDVDHLVEQEVVERPVEGRVEIPPCAQEEPAGAAPFPSWTVLQPGQRAVLVDLDFGPDAGLGGCSVYLLSKCPPGPLTSSPAPQPQPKDRTRQAGRLP